MCTNKTSVSTFCLTFPFFYRVILLTKLLYKDIYKHLFTHRKVHEFNTLSIYKYSVYNVTCTQVFLSLKIV